MSNFCQFSAVSIFNPQLLFYVVLFIESLTFKPDGGGGSFQ